MKDKKVQTAFRFDPILIGRLKEVARRADVSLNEYVTIILTKATEDVESEMEMEDNKRKTEEFLSKITMAWVGDETKEQILESIRKGRKPRKTVEL